MIDLEKFFAYLLMAAAGRYKKKFFGEIIFGFATFQFKILLKSITLKKYNLIMNTHLINKEKVKKIAIALIISLFIPAISIFLHELGHYIIAFFSGFTESIIHYQYLEILPRTNDISFKVRSLSLIGGPISSIFQVLISLFFIYKGSNNPIFYGFGLFSQIQILRFMPNIEDSEEFRFGIYQNIPGITIWLFSFIIFIIGIGYILIIIIRRKQYYEFVGLLIGLILGFLIWMYLLGPVIMP